MINSFFFTGDTCPDTGLDECSLELSVTKGYPQCIWFNVTASDGENVTISTDNNGRRLPDSRYVTLRRKYHQLTLAEVEVFGGKCSVYSQSKIFHLTFII